ncbi:MAG: hypothetical protein KGN01_07415 [Patescibacteria group bacterium]|nr:hypothetical protein [Patescibacteria group bacterium]
MSLNVKVKIRKSGSEGIVIEIHPIGPFARILINNEKLWYWFDELDVIV